jgi:hypothetical protein
MLRPTLSALVLAALVPLSAEAVNLPGEPFDLSDPDTRPFVIGIDMSDLLEDDPNDPSTFPPLDGNDGTTGGPYLDFCGWAQGECPTLALMVSETTWAFVHPATATEALVSMDPDMDSIPGSFASPGFENAFGPDVHGTAFFVDSVTRFMSVDLYGLVSSASLGELAFQAQYHTATGPWILPANPLVPAIPMPAVTIGAAGDRGGFTRGDLFGTTLTLFCTDTGSVPKPAPSWPDCDDPNAPLSYIADVHGYDLLTGEASAWAPIQMTTLDDPSAPLTLLLADSLGDVRFREIPEPATVLLLGAGAVGLVALRRWAR